MCFLQGKTFLQRSVRTSLNQQSSIAAQTHPLQAPLSSTSCVTTTTTTTVSWLTSYLVCYQIRYKFIWHMSVRQYRLSLFLRQVEMKRPKHNFKTSRPSLSPHFEIFQFLGCFMGWFWNTKFTKFLSPFLLSLCVHFTVPGCSNEIPTTLTAMTYTTTPLYDVQPCTLVFTSGPDEGIGVTIADSKGNSAFCGQAFIDVHTGKK